MIFKSENVFLKLVSENLPYMLLLMIAVIGITSIFFFIMQLFAGQVVKINYKNFPLTRILYFVFGGFLAGVIYGIFDISLDVFIDSNLSSLNAENIILFQLFIIIAFSIMSSFFTSILSISILLATSIFNLLNSKEWQSVSTTLNDNTHLMIFLIVSYTVSLILIVIYRGFITFSKKKNDKKNNILFSAVISSIILIIYLISFNVVLDSSIYQFIFNYLISIFLLIFLLVIFKNIDKIISDTFFLKRSIVYDDEVFVREEFANNIFLKFISKNRVSYGLFFKILFNGTDEISERFGASEKEKIEMMIINDFFNLLESKKLFLKNGYNEKMFFVPLDLSIAENKKTVFNNKILMEMDNIINKVSKKYEINNVKIDISIKIFGTIYGIESCDLSILNKRIEKIDINNFNHNKNKSIFLFDKQNDVQNSEWENYQRIRREGKINSINTKIIKINNDEYISPIYNSDDDWEIRNINYLALEKYCNSLSKSTNAKILLRLVHDNVATLKDAKSLLKKIQENEFNILPIYFYTQKNIKIPRSIRNLFKNNNIFIL